MPKLRPTQMRAKKFYDFCDMRLRGRSDTTYRMYDLLRQHNKVLATRPFMWKVRYAGLYWPLGGEYEVLSTLQRHFENRGHGLVSTPVIKKLINEHYIYRKIIDENMNWCLRDPDEATMLYEQHLASLAEVL